jgi:hypothetical protein
MTAVHEGTVIKLQFVPMSLVKHCNNMLNARERIFVDEHVRSSGLFVQLNTP